MKPYLAVIADSFHSALSSRILWVALVAIWLFLAALAPIGYHEDYTTTFRWFDLDNGTQMKAMLARGLVDPREQQTALGRLARTFPEDIRRKLRQVAEGDDIRIDKTALADSLNASLDDEDWYDRRAWQSTVRLRELRELDELAADQLSESQRRRRARLRIEAALPGVFAAQSARSITLSYAGFDFPAYFMIGKTQFIALVHQFVIPIMMDWLLGFALIFLGILVTASIIPDMLQPGSLHLLLSKPISRTMLLLSKFVGGCAFVFLCVCQLVIGLWLIAGFRLDLWNARILWCIPVAVFLFAIFFSVSVLAGLRWRSPILSIGITCMFGAFVLVIGLIGGYFDNLVRAPDRISRMAFDDRDIVIATRGGELKRFDSASNQWVGLIEGDFRRRDLIVPPVRLAEDRIATARIRNGRFNLYGSGSLDLLILDGDRQWEPQPGLRLPNGTRRMDAIGDSLIVLNNTGLMATSIAHALRESGFSEPSAVAENDGLSQPNDSTEDSAASKPSGESSASADSIAVTAWISDLLRMQGGATESFESILPPGVTLTEPVRVSTVPSQSALIVYSRGRLLRLVLPANDRPAGETSQSPDRNLVATLAKDLLMEDTDAAKTVMAAGEGSVFLAREGEPVRLLDVRTFETLAEFESPDQRTIVSAVALADLDQFAFLTTDGTVRVTHRAGDGVAWTTLPQSEVTAIDHDRQTRRLVVAHHVDSVDVLDVSQPGRPPRTVRSIRPTLTSWRSVDRYLITPLRMLTPQTGELSQTVAALVSGKTSFAIGDPQDDQEVIRLKIARPLFSCGAFLVVMLSIACVYFNRRDF